MVLKSSTALYADRVKKELGDLITKSIYNLFARCVVKTYCKGIGSAHHAQSPPLNGVGVHLIREELAIKARVGVGYISQ